MQKVNPNKTNPQKKEDSPNLQLTLVYGKTRPISNSEWVYAKLPSGEFIQKRLSMVKPGDDLLISKHEIPNLTVSQLDEALTQYSPYLRLQKDLFVYFEQSGTTRPVFQQALLQGIIDKPEAWPTILSNDPTIRAQFSHGTPLELTYDQSKQAADFIHSHLVEKKVEHPVSAGHIQDGWLAGKVVGPNNLPEIFTALQEISGRLGGIYETFSAAYRDYRGLRSKAAVQLNNFLHKGQNSVPPGQATKSQPEQNETGQEHISIKDAVGFIISYFATDISKSYLVARVLDVSAPKPSSHTENKGEAHQRREKTEAPLSLFKGVVTQMISDEEIRLKPLEQVGLEYNVLESAALIVAGKLYYDNKALFSEGPHNGRESQIYIFQLKNEISQFLGYKEPHDINVERIVEGNRLKNYLLSPSQEEAIKKAARILCERLMDGSMESRYGLKRGTLFHLFESENKLRSAVPASAIEAMMLTRLISDMIEENKSRISKQLPVRSTKPETNALEKLLKDRRTKDAFAGFSKQPSARETLEILDCLGFGSVARNQSFLIL